MTGKGIPDTTNSGSASVGSTLMHDAMHLRDALGLSNRDARSEVELLFTRALGITRAGLIAHPERALEAASNSCYRQSLQRRLDGEPIAYILGEREFYGYVFRVSPDVLIPRPETELLVDMSLEKIDPNGPFRLLDLGTGSGAIAVAIAKQRPNIEFVAVDASGSALNMAITNSKHLLSGERGNFKVSNWFDQLDETRFEMIVSNPPYVAAGDEHLERGDLRFEPRQALVGGRDGLEHLRHIIAGASDYLCDSGWLLFEHGYDQAAACRDLLADAGYTDIASERDLAGQLRVTGGRWLTGASGTG